MLRLLACCEESLGPSSCCERVTALQVSTSSMESTVHTLSSKLDLLMLTVMAQANKDQRSARTRARASKIVCDDVAMCRGKRLEEESQAAQAEQSNALLDAVHSDALLFD